MIGYDESIEGKMVHLYDSLSEKDRRRYAAVEAEKLPHGGVEYIANLFGCDPKTIRRGCVEVDALPQDTAAGRIRKKGAAAAMLAKRSRDLSKRSARKSNAIRPDLR